MASIHEVARDAGVSITTVSHVFSGKRPVASATRRKVLSVARRLNYRPHRAARGLATGKAMTIGLRFPFEGDSFVLNPYFPELLEGLSAAAAEAGYGFLLLPSEAGSRRRLEDLLRAGRMDGVIVVDPVAQDPLIPKLRRRGITVATTGRYPGATGLPWVDNDHRGGMVQLFRHLDEQGYRAPALLSLRGRISYVQDIEAAYRSEAQARGAPVVIRRPEDLSEELAYRIARRLLGGRTPPDAIIAGVDRQAVGILRAAQELGIRVPEELGVAGEGDTVLARHSHPPLTSVRVRPRRLGEAAVGTLLAALDGVGTPDNQVLPAELVVRRSTRRMTSAGRR